MKTKYDWTNVPKNIKFIATDVDKLVVGFTKFPNKVYLNSFSCGNNGGTFVLVGLFPYQGNWKDSLEERPHDQ